MIRIAFAVAGAALVVFLSGFVAGAYARELGWVEMGGS